MYTKFAWSIVLYSSFFAIPLLGVKSLQELQHDADTVNKARQSMQQTFNELKGVANFGAEEDLVISLLGNVSERLTSLEYLAEGQNIKKELQATINEMPELYVLEDVSREDYVRKLTTFFDRITKVLNTLERSVQVAITQQMQPTVPQPAPSIFFKRQAKQVHPSPAKSLRKPVVSQPAPSQQVRPTSLAPVIQSAIPVQNRQATVAEILAALEELKPRLMADVVWIPGQPWPQRQGLSKDLREQVFTRLATLVVENKAQEKLEDLRERSVLLITLNPYQRNVDLRISGGWEPFLDELEAFIRSLKK